MDDVVCLSVDFMTFNEIYLELSCKRQIRAFTALIVPSFLMFAIGVALDPSEPQPSHGHVLSRLSPLRFNLFDSSSAGFDGLQELGGSPLSEC